MSDFFSSSSSERWLPYYHQKEQTTVTATAASSVPKCDVTSYYDQEEHTTAATAAAAVTSTSSVPNPAAAGRRRRSPSTSRRSNTPTTLLNANPSNFRALVQQFTGCSSSRNSDSGKRKGPITLNFAAPVDDYNGNSYSISGYNSGYDQGMQTASYQQGNVQETVSYQAADQQSGYIGDVDDGMAMLEELVMDDLDSLLSR